MRILPLHNYDMIIGMDWLETHSPMKVHWKHKWMSIPHQGSQALLQGITDDTTAELFVHLSVLSGIAASNHTPPLTGELKELLEDFAVVFDSPTDLPPRRTCDHVIPLVSGAKPVYIRPDRYSPALKDEIEK
jgi:hypothetical protein